MKKNLIILFILVIITTNCVFSQDINFGSYGRISNASFLQFVSLFKKKNLPISTNSLFSDANLKQLQALAISQKNIEKYLTKDGELISGPLYNNKPDENIAEVPVIGKFYPLYQLPTNGDYVLLVFAQIEPYLDGNDRVFVLSYDLNGNYLSYINKIYAAGSEYINNYIDAALKSHYTYVLYYVNGELTFPPIDQVFTGTEAHSILQINTQGKPVELSFEKTSGQFMFSTDEYRFKKEN